LVKEAKSEEITQESGLESCLWWWSYWVSCRYVSEPYEIDIYFYYALNWSWLYQQL